MRYAEDDLLALSGVQHIVFCERQASLIYVERAWADNALTVDGSHRHAGVHEQSPRRERRGDLLIVRGLALRSLELGLAGVADVVEFHRTGERLDKKGVPQGAELPNLPGFWVPFPVEYKRGRPKPHRADEVQLCAQALCLEEMLGVSIAEGALFYGKEQRRVPVTLDDELRALTADAAFRLHRLLREGITPPAVREPKCERCSLLELCLPQAMTRRRSAQRFLTANLHRLLTSGEDAS